MKVKLLLDFSKDIIIDDKLYENVNENDSIFLDMFGYSISTYQGERTLFLNLDFVNSIKIFSKEISDGEIFKKYVTLYKNYIRVKKINNLIV